MDWDSAIIKNFELKSYLHPARFFLYVLFSLFLAVGLAVFLNTANLTINQEQRAELQEMIIETAKSPFKLLFTFSLLVVEDFWAVFLPLVFLNKINFFHKKTRILIVSMVFALIHLLNFFNFFYIIPLFFANLLHVKVADEHGFVAGAHFHILYDAIIYSVVVLVSFF